MKKFFSYYNEPITIKHNWALVLYGAMLIVSSNMFDVAWYLGTAGYFVAGLFLSLVEDRSK